MVRRLSAMLNVYPPNRSTKVMKMSRNAASQRGLGPNKGGFPKPAVGQTGGGPRGGMAAHHAEEAAGGRGKGEGNRGELKREIDRGEPRHVEAEPLRREQAEHPIHARERSCEPKEVHLP